MKRRLLVVATVVCSLFIGGYLAFKDDHNDFSLKKKELSTLSEEERYRNFCAQAARDEALRLLPSADA